MKEVIIKLSEQEAKVLTQLIDLAVKAGGINVAEAAVVLVKKIEESASENKE